MTFSGGNFSHQNLSIKKPRIFYLGCQWLTFLTLLSGCFNNFGSSNGTKSTKSSNSLLSGLAAGTPGFVLTSVVKNAVNPTQIIDLIGDGTGAFGVRCLGGQACACRFIYDVPGLGTQTFDQAINYIESDLARCQYTPLSGNAQNIKVQLVQLTLNQYTNQQYFALVGAGGQFDTTSALNFSNIIRFQCRQYPNIPLAFYPNIYDPILSEDPVYTYPLDFYTSNPYRAISEALYLYAQNQSSVGWDCPAAFNDPNAGLNLKLYTSGKFDYNFQSTKELYPTPPGFPDRQSFSLSKIQAGIFTEAVSALVVPGEPRIPRPTIGYAAKATVLSPGIEQCPSANTPIPPGFTWKKLWLYRADLAPRKLPFSQKISQVGAVACNPGVVDAQTPPVARGCHDASAATAFADLTKCGLADYNGNACSAGRPLVDRVFGNGQCFGLAANRTPAVSNGYTSGTEEWQKKINSNLLYTCTEVAAGRATDPLNVCRTGQNPIAPLDTQVAVGSNLDQNQTRYDFLFVVSDVAINTIDMQNVTSPVAQSYTPVRFYMTNDCPDSDPDSINCDQTRRINYGLKLHDINGNGDPPASDPRRPGTFPLCVLQRL